MNATDEAAAIILGIGVFSVPFIVVFEIVFRIIIHLLHLSHDGQYAMSGIIVGGWMGAGAARLENIKKTSTMP